MTATSALTMEDATRPGFLSTLRALCGMSWPIMLGALAMSVLNLGQISLLGHLADPDPLYRMSLIQPYYLLFFAILEALAVTAQVFSARSRKAWPRGAVRTACLLLSSLGAAVILGLLLVADRLLPLLAGVWPVIGTEVAGILAPYLVSLLPLLVFEIFNGALRGQGRTLPGFLILGAAVALNLGLSYLFAYRAGCGLDGLIVANLLTGAVALIAVALWLAVALRAEPGGRLPQTAMRLGLLLGVVGAPILLSLLVSFASSSVLIDRVAQFARADAAALVIVIRIRYFFLIPSIALATAIAILVNQRDERESGGAGRAILIQGVAALAGLYLALTAALYALRVPLLGRFAADPEVAGAALTIIGILLPSFFLVALGVALQVILENLSRGLRVLVWTVVLEVATCAGLYVWAVDLASALTIIVIAAFAYVVAFGGEYLLLLFGRGQVPAPLPPAVQSADA